MVGLFPLLFLLLVLGFENLSLLNPLRRHFAIENLGAMKVYGGLRATLLLHRCGVFEDYHSLLLFFKAILFLEALLLPLLFLKLGLEPGVTT